MMGAPSVTLNSAWLLLRAWAAGVLLPASGPQTAGGMMPLAVSSLISRFN